MEIGAPSTRNGEPLVAQLTGVHKTYYKSDGSVLVAALDGL